MSDVAVVERGCCYEMDCSLLRWVEASEVEVEREDIQTGLVDYSSTTVSVTKSGCVATPQVTVNQLRHLPSSLNY